jgi:RNA polymerase sigma-70 factor, ECF subfamily
LDADKLLVEKAVSGDLRAYEILILKYQKKIQRLISRMVKDTDAVQDIAQDTFIKAYQALHQFRGDAQFYTWLYRIAINTAKKYLVDCRRNPVISENALKNPNEDETFGSLASSTDETPDP